jgi:hypothetical protein
MDGEDAVEFFEAFRQEFEVDLADLDIHWPVLRRKPHYSLFNRIPVIHNAE